MTEAGRFTESFLAEVRARTSLVALIGRELPLRRAGREHVGLCPFHGERTPSFTVVEAKGFWHCFGCGAHGDAIGWLQHRHGMSFVDAVSALAAEAGLLPDRDGRRLPAPKPVVARESAAEREREEGAATARAWEAFRAGGPIAGTAVETYLAGRGLPLALIDATVHRYLRCAVRPYFHQAEGWPAPRVVHEGPAMLACMLDARTGAFKALHMTWLAPNGQGKARIADPDNPKALLPAKKMRGPAWGALIPLVWHRRSRLMLGEGIETSLSGAVECGESWDVAAAGSLGNIAGRGLGEGPPDPCRPGSHLPSPLPDMDGAGVTCPPWVTELALLEDSNSTSMHEQLLQERARLRFHELGHLVRPLRAPAGMDWNDVRRQAAGEGRDHV